MTTCRGNMAWRVAWQSCGKRFSSARTVHCAKLSLPAASLLSLGGLSLRFLGVVGRRERWGPLAGTFRLLSTSRENEDEVNEEPTGTGIVVGCYATDSGYELTQHAKNIDAQTDGRLSHLMNISGGRIKKGESRLFYGVTQDHAHVAVVGVGKSHSADDPDPLTSLEDIDVGRQNIRSAAAVGTKMMQKARVKEVLLDDFGDPEACAEGSVLSLFSFDKFKAEKKRKMIPAMKPLSGSSGDHERWSKGLITATAQNFARELMETPSNHMTPTMFVDTVSSHLGGIRISSGTKLEVVPRPLSWIESQKMGAFLSVSKGSAEKPWLLELRYNYTGEETEGQRPVVLVGKGVTFDTGGISIKPSPNMDMMRGDMGGAACVAATVMAIAELRLPLSVVGLIPLCENMPSGTAVKPGDVVRAMNGKTIQVDNTDAEGRLLLADALCYAHSFTPTTIVDLATLTGHMDIALGTGAAGVFTTSNPLWKKLHQAGQWTGDRLWKMPLFEQYTKQMESHLADINNLGTKTRSAGACTAAAFLKEFVEVESWAHIDIAGVMQSGGELPFLSKGMTGRPTRTLIKFLEDLNKQTVA